MNRCICCVLLVTFCSSAYGIEPQPLEGVHTSEVIKANILVPASATPSPFTSPTHNPASHRASAHACPSACVESILSLEKCLKTALSNNIELKGQKHVLQSTIYQIREAKARLKPQFNLQNVQTHSKNLLSFGEATIGKHDTNISRGVLQQPVYSFGRLNLGLDMVKVQRQSEEKALRAKTEDILARVIRSYIDNLNTQNRLRIASESCQLIKAHLVTTQSLYDAGVILKTDVSSTRVKLLEAQQKLVEEESALEIARENLSNLLGISPVEVTGVSQIIDSDVAFDKWQNLASNTNTLSPEIERLDCIVSMLKKKLALEKKGKLPALGFQAIYSTGNEFNDSFKNWNAMLVLEIPVFDGGTVKARKNQAEEELEKTKCDRENVVRQLNLMARTSYLKAKDIEKKIGLAKEALQVAQENLDQNVINFKEGTVINTDVLSAQLLLNNAKVKYNEAVFDYLQHLTDYFKNTGNIKGFLSEILDVNISWPGAEK
ncbi:MAG: TolC family protein [Candidatus Riflebacteria bacterium]|nr:TolC family protein [Candidatus Riflebacteria bacterium]